MSSMLSSKSMVQPLLPSEKVWPGNANKPEWKTIRNHYYNYGKLHKQDVKKIIDQAGKLFQSESNLIVLNDPITIVGDIHGQINDLYQVLEAGGDPSQNNQKYLFLGDYVDRGRYGIEVMLLIYALKINFPNRIFCLRGNHETISVTMAFGFKQECNDKYDQEIYESAVFSFNQLPLAAVINGKFLAMHGGLSPDLRNIFDINKLNRFQEPPEQGMFQDILWSDPLGNDTGVFQNKNIAFAFNNTRQCSYMFGVHAVQLFLKNNNLISLIRAHEVQNEGYKLHWISNKTQMAPVVTIFSASNYGSQYRNRGAIIKLSNHTNFDIVKYYLDDPFVIDPKFGFPPAVDKSDSVLSEEEEEMLPLQISMVQSQYKKTDPGDQQFFEKAKEADMLFEAMPQNLNREEVNKITSNQGKRNIEEMKSASNYKTVGNFCYNIHNLIGQGQYTKVCLAWNTVTGELGAIKVIDKKQLNITAGDIQNEILTMKKVKSDYVVKYIDVKETQNNIYIIQELCEGGNLTQYLDQQDNRNIKEEEALFVLSCILEGQKELLKHGLIHRDLRPDNVLKQQDHWLLNNFGLNMILDYLREKSPQNKNLLSFPSGKPEYLSPQLLNKEKFTNKCDIWSIGVIYYEMLTGKVPFTIQKNIIETLTTINKGKVDFPPNISGESKSFIEGCLQPSEEKRFTWQQVFEHPLLAKYKFQGKVEENKASYLLNFMRLKINTKNIDVQQLFKEIGLKDNNSIDRESFSKFVKSVVKSIQNEEIEQLFKNIDRNGDNKIDIFEFQLYLKENGININRQTQNLSEKAMNNLGVFVRNNNIDLRKLFAKYDKDSNDFLDFPEFKTMLKEIDPKIPDDDVENVFHAFDVNQDQKVSFQEFCDILADYALINKDKGTLAIHELAKFIRKNNMSMLEVFQKFDINPDKNLDFQEFQRLIVQVNNNLQPEELKTIFSKFDINKDGKISFKEFWQTLELYYAKFR